MEPFDWAQDRLSRNKLENKGSGFSTTLEMTGKYVFGLSKKRMSLFDSIN